MRKIIFILLALTVMTFSCKKEGKMPPIDEAVDLDGSLVNDSSLTNPQNFLLSAAIPNPTPADLATPIVICVHGFSATTFEWSEFRDFSKQSGTFYTSQVLMGGHGRDYDDFKNATYEDWQLPVIQEYNALRNMGYQRISFAGASTGCPVILDIVNEGKINPDVLENIFMIDPIVIPSNKTLSLIGVAGPILGYVTVTDMADNENGFWYKYRPYQSLKQLNKFTRKIRKELQKGVSLPSSVNLIVYKSKKDGTADPASAVFLNEGVKGTNGGTVSVQMFDSELHVMTRLAGRPEISAADILNQQTIFADIKSKL